MSSSHLHKIPEIPIKMQEIQNKMLRIVTKLKDSKYYLSAWNEPLVLQGDMHLYANRISS